MLWGEKRRKGKAKGREGKRGGKENVLKSREGGSEWMSGQLVACRRSLGSAKITFMQIRKTRYQSLTLRGGKWFVKKLE